MLLTQVVELDVKITQMNFPTISAKWNESQWYIAGMVSTTRSVLGPGKA